MKGVKLFLFEINYLRKLNFFFIIHQAIKILTLSIHSDKLSCFLFFDQGARNILWKAEVLK